MNTITLFLKKLRNTTVQPSITQGDIEFVINERLKEKARLEKMLKTLRWQATSQLDEIKNLHGTILEQQSEKQSLIEKIESLNIDYLKVLETYDDDKEKLLILKDKLANLDTERLKIYELNKQIKLLENEFENLKQNVLKENEALKRLRNEKLFLIKNKIKFNSTPEKKQKKNPAKKTKSTRCTAKTKLKHRCKNHKTGNSDFCYVHAIALSPKRKMKIVNFNG